ncbi:6-carboxytetrahydropterin synthase QueD [Desulfonatronovibrio magnus]|uniref:6-carboxytetrahydropterin synthase QueD n=1 Tax=Desulfonatronovibrio magnus TaxID=698827 RepID=UPI0005EB2E36|nr:6-carboxytetrahydropterin synthase QueD [Desulfonatronovibrio magnus]
MTRPQWQLRVSAEFSSSHQLRNYCGKCENLHGHNFQVEVQVKGVEVNADTGMLMDFKDLKKILNTVLEELDHKHLNDLEYFKTINPSSENIARYIYERIKPVLPPQVDPDWVMVAEKKSSRAFYQER